MMRRGARGRLALGILTAALVIALTLGLPDQVWRLPTGLLAAGLALMAWVVSERRVRTERSQWAAAEGAAQSFLATGLYDPLTHLPNRALLNELLEKQVAQAQRSGHVLGVVVCDLDRFKSFNDSLGESAADRLLCQVADRFGARIRQADTLARTGGDAFTLVVPRAERPDDVVRAARRMLATLDEPFTPAAEEVLVAASAGISVFPQDAKEVSALLGQAEEALARAKAQGGNNIQIFEPSMNRRTRERAALEQELRRAIEAQTLCVHYQPQVDLADGRLVGMEGLVRWEHPEKGLLPAGDFISLAEEGGLMSALGGWVTGEVCRQNAEWHQRGLSSFPVSVNVSVRQFQAGDVAAAVRRALETSGLSPQLLQLEITETVAMLESAQVVEALVALKEIGVQIHLDDFGTGYSSLSYLLRYPTDVLKIDRSFVEGVPDRRENARIVQLMISLASGLGLGLIAEGVETPEQLTFLHDAGCPAAQGFLLGRPLPVGEFELLLERGRVDLTAWR